MNRLQTPLRGGDGGALLLPPRAPCPKTSPQTAKAAAKRPRPASPGETARSGRIAARGLLRNPSPTPRKEPCPHGAHAVQRERNARPRSLRRHPLRHCLGCRLNSDTPRRRAPADSRLWQSPPPSPADSRSAFPPGRPVPSGASRSIKRRLPPNTPTGSPPPTILPSVTRSASSQYISTCPAQRHTKAGHHLVDNQQRPFARRNRPQPGQVARRRAQCTPHCPPPAPESPPQSPPDAPQKPPPPTPRSL